MNSERVRAGLLAAGLMVSLVFVLPTITSPAHGATYGAGIVCFSATATSCPSSPASFSAPIGSFITLNVVIQGSNATNGFEVGAGNDPTVLNATSVSLAGTVLPGATVGLECINGRGSSICPFYLGNGPGIVMLTATGSFTTAPTTGLLFSITYKVIGTGASSSLGFFFFTSPSGPWYPGAVGVSTATGWVLVPAQGATFTTSSSPPTAFSFNQARTFDNVTVTVVGNFTISTTTKTLTGSLSLNAVNDTSKATIFSKTFSISLSFGTSNTVKFGLSIPFVPVMLATSCTITIDSTAVASCTLSRDPDVNHDGTVNILDVSMLAYAYGSTVGSARYSQAVDLNADGIVNIIDAAIIAYYYGEPVF